MLPVGFAAGAFPPAGFAGAPLPGNAVFALSCSLSKLLVATTSPGLIPVTAVSSSVRHTGLNVAHVRDVILNNVDERDLPIVLNRRGGNKGRSTQRVDQ